MHEVNTFLAPKQDTLIRVLSIGTMTIGATVRGGASLDRGFGKWRGGLFDLVISAQESSVDYMLRQSLGDNYFQIDDQATPDQEQGREGVGSGFPWRHDTLKDRGNHAAQRALGDPLFKPFRAHQASAPIFYHGPNKNVPEAVC